MSKKVDVLIIGAGIIGSALARELSRYNCDIALVEKNSDVCDEVSKANSGIVHAGFDDTPDTIKHKFCIKGRRFFPILEQELHISYRPLPSMVLAFHTQEMESLQELYNRGISYGINDISILNAREALDREPWLNENIYAALYCGESGLVSPYEFGIALAENAIQNGTSIYISHEVYAIEQTSQNFLVHTRTVDSNTLTFNAKIVVNAAGLYADSISQMLGIDDYSIHPRKGQYLLFDRGSANSLGHILFQCPSKMGKGVLVTPTYHGNLMIGPNAEDHKKKDNVDTDSETLAQIFEAAKKSVSSIPNRPIRSYAGNRPISSTGDFIVRESKIEGFYELAGIASPGLTSAYAIAECIASKIAEKYQLSKNTAWSPTRSAIIPSNTNRQFLPMKDIKTFTDLEMGNDERIVCRCEQVREKTIKDALSRGIPINNTDAVKRRTRAGMGSCQGQFCRPRVRELIAKYNNIELSNVNIHGNTAEPHKARLHVPSTSKKNTPRR